MTEDGTHIEDDIVTMFEDSDDGGNDGVMERETKGVDDQTYQNITIRIVFDGHLTDADAVRDRLVSSICRPEFATHVGAIACVERTKDRDVAYVAIEVSDGMTLGTARSLVGMECMAVPSQGDRQAALAFMNRTGTFSDRKVPFAAKPATGGRMTGVLCMKSDWRQPTSRTRKRQTTNCIAMALETTGLDPFKNEVTRVSIYGNNGDTIYDRTFGVDRPEEWDDYAKGMNTITPVMVQGLMTFKDAVTGDARLSSILNAATIIVGHNMRFILGFLGRAGVNLDGKRFGDTNKCFVTFAYKHKLYNASGRLATAAKTFRLPPPRFGHTEDKAKATYDVWLALVERHGARTKTLDEMRSEYANAKRRKPRKVKA